MISINSAILGRVVKFLLPKSIRNWCRRLRGICSWASSESRSIGTIPWPSAQSKPSSNDWRYEILKISWWSIENNFIGNSNFLYTMTNRRHWNRYWQIQWNLSEFSQMEVFHFCLFEIEIHSWVVRLWICLQNRSSWSCWCRDVNCLHCEALSSFTWGNFLGAETAFCFIKSTWHQLAPGSAWRTWVGLARVMAIQLGESGWLGKADNVWQYFPIWPSVNTFCCSADLQQDLSRTIEAKLGKSKVNIGTSSIAGVDTFAPMDGLFASEVIRKGQTFLFILYVSLEAYLFVSKCLNFELQMTELSVGMEDWWQLIHHYTYVLFACAQAGSSILVDQRWLRIPSFVWFNLGNLFSPSLTTLRMVSMPTLACVQPQ